MYMELLKERLQSLTPQQARVIFLALDGKNWKSIAHQLDISYHTILKWRNEPVFKEVMLVCQESILMDISSQISKGVNNAFVKLNEMVQQDKFEDSKAKTEAIKTLWELCLKTADYSKIIEDNRRLNNKENFGDYLGIDYFEKIDVAEFDATENKSKTKS